MKHLGIVVCLLRWCLFLFTNHILPK